MADELLNQGEDENPSEEAQRGETVTLPDDDLEVEDTEDGGAVIRMKNEGDVADKKAHFANIVDEVDPGMLSDAVVDLLDKIERDKDAREKRDKLYEEGLRRTGLGDDAPGGAQFSGANKVVHPMLVEACVDFSARFMKESPSTTSTCRLRPPTSTRPSARRTCSTSPRPSTTAA
jgi:hypothetical protein